MTKVEELLGRLEAVIPPDWWDTVKDGIANLVVLAHAEGVVEGAEQGVRKERRRLKATRERYVEGVRFINDVGYYLIPLRAFRVPLASVLAPTKESEVPHTNILYPPDEMKP